MKEPFELEATAEGWQARAALGSAVPANQSIRLHRRPARRVILASVALVFASTTQAEPGEFSSCGELERVLRDSLLAYERARHEQWGDEARTRVRARFDECLRSGSFTLATQAHADSIRFSIDRLRPLGNEPVSTPRALPSPEPSPNSDVFLQAAQAKVDEARARIYGLQPNRPVDDSTRKAIATLLDDAEELGRAAVASQESQEYARLAESIGALREHVRAPAVPLDPRSSPPSPAVVRPSAPTVPQSATETAAPQAGVVARTPLKDLLRGNWLVTAVVGLAAALALGVALTRLHKSGRITIFSSYTDAAVTVALPSLTAVFLALAPLASGTATVPLWKYWLGLASFSALLAIREAFATNHWALAPIALFARVFAVVAAVFLFVLGFLRGDHASRRKGESKRDFNARSRRAGRDQQVGVLVAALAMLFVLSEWSRFEGFVGLGDFLRGRRPISDPEEAITA